MEFIVPIAIIGIFWGTVLAIVRSTQDFVVRKRLIDKGLSPSEIKELFSQPKPVDPYPNLKWGMVLAGVGGAIIVGEYLQNEQITAGLMVLMGGVGFLIYFLATKKYLDQHDNRLK